MTEETFHTVDIEYLIDRLEQVIGLIKAGENHMAIAKLLADISALRGMLETDKGVDHD